MPGDSGKSYRSRIVVETPSARYQRGAPTRGGKRSLGRPEGIIALTVIGAAALATFLALFVTSRSFDPMNSTVAPQQTVPLGPATLQPTPKQSPSPAAAPSQRSLPAESPEPGGVSQVPPDDGAIQAEIEKVLAADATLARLDVSTLVESGKVTIVGSVRTAELKQRLERTIRSVKGISTIDNQLVVVDATP